MRAARTGPCRTEKSSWASPASWKKKTYIRLESKRSSQISTIKEVFLLSSTDQDEKIQNKTYLGIRPFEDLYVRPRRELFQNTRFF